MSINTTTGPTIILLGVNGDGHACRPVSSCCSATVMSYGANEKFRTHVQDDLHVTERASDPTVLFVCGNCNQQLAVPAEPASPSGDSQDRDETGECIHCGWTECVCRNEDGELIDP